MVNVELLKKVNLKRMCDKTGLSYNIMRNFMCGRTKNLSDEYEKTINEYIDNIKWNN